MTAASIDTTIIEPLRPLAAPLADLATDPSNARRGDVDAVRRSLATFGQRKPVVVKRTGTDAGSGRPVGTVIAGNHTLLAARALGWTHLAAVFTDDSETTAKAYALADNRTGEIASWDTEALTATLAELAVTDLDMSTLGWTDAELAKILDPGDLSAFKAYDESAADAVRTASCPECGHQFPL
jgi:ParB-like chromosome segregation protein Spo0J